MTLPAAPRAFPIPVVAAFATNEDETLDYLRMPSGMDTYRPPLLPEPEALAGHDSAVQVLRQAMLALQQCGRGEVPAPVRLDGLPEADRQLINQVLGEGEVSAQVLAVPDAVDGRRTVQIQESVFAGLWRVVTRADDGALRDTLEAGAVPAVLSAAAREDGRHPPAAMAPPPNVINAASVLSELADLRRHWQPGQAPAVINLSLLPMSPEDIAYLDHQLGTGRVLILSRGYGNCRITDACVPHTWRVVYYNSQDTVILNTVEVCAMPEAACAAPEDLADSAQRLAEVLQWVEQAGSRT